MWCRSQTADLPVPGTRFQTDGCDGRSGEGNHWLNPKIQIPKKSQKQKFQHISPLIMLPFWEFVRLGFCWDLEFGIWDFWFIYLRSHRKRLQRHPSIVVK